MLAHGFLSEWEERISELGKRSEACMLFDVSRCWFNTINTCHLVRFYQDCFHSSTQYFIFLNEKETYRMDPESVS